MPKRENPPIECSKRQLYARDDMGDFEMPCGIGVAVTSGHVVMYLVDRTRIPIPRADFDALVRWYTGTDKQPRATKGTR